MNPNTTEIERKIVKVSIISIPGPFLTAFGLLGKFGAPEEIPFEFLNNSTMVNVMLAVGVVIMIGATFSIFKLFLERGNV